MTTKSTHTPGPWSLEIGPTACFHEGNELAIVKHEQEAGEIVTSTIAEVWPSGEPGMAEADAARIVACVNACEGINPAAVPDMVTALQKAADALAVARTGYPFTPSDPPAAGTAEATVRAVIAKATG